MARLSAIERGKKLLAEIQNFGGKLGHSGLEILRPLGNGLKVGFAWLFERGEKFYGSLEKRFAPVLRRWLESLAAWWKRRGWSPSLLGHLANALLYLPVDSVWYLLACVEHLVRFNPPYFLAWLAFAGSVRAWRFRFNFKEILPDPRAAQPNTAANGTPVERGGL